MSYEDVETLNQNRTAKFFKCFAIFQTESFIFES